MGSFIRTNDCVEKRIYMLRPIDDAGTSQTLDTSSLTCKRLLSSSRFLHKLHDISWFCGLEQVKFLFSINVGKEGFLRGWPMWSNIYKMLKTMHRESVIYFFFWGQIVVHCYENVNLEINHFYGIVSIAGNWEKRGRAYNTDFIQAKLEYV